jgi:ATP-dependent DNA helicase RecQ
VRALVGYFGEERAERCGHCSHCLTGRAQQLPSALPKPPLEGVVDAAALAALRAEHPAALAAPRQQARFLAGITSPATTRAKLTNHGLFGALAERRFADVLAWCETSAA